VTLPPLTVTSTREGRVCVLGVSGELDIATTPALTQQAAAALRLPAERLIIDLSGLEFIDCCGARALAAEILDGSPTSVRISLQVMEETRGIPDVVDAVTHPTTAFDDLMTSEDAIEGLTAFAQKRRPHWRNR